MTRRWLAVALVLVGLSATLVANVVYVVFEQITVANTAIGFTTAKITPTTQLQAQTAFCRSRTAEISYTVDGTTPTTTVGLLWEPGEEKTLTGHDTLERFKAIRTTATSAQLDCVYTAP